MAIYETIFILDSLMPPKEIDAAIERFSSIITSNGGKVRKVEKWGKRRLAYEIEKKQYGFYGSIEFEATGNIPKELESEYNFNDKVLRYLTYRYDKRKLKAMQIEDTEAEAKRTEEAATAAAEVAAKAEAPVEGKPTEEKAAATETPAPAPEPAPEAEEPKADETNNEENK
ncbi:30S ribosomal protein S6 [Calditrichota bacterium GD2]